MHKTINRLNVGWATLFAFAALSGCQSQSSVSSSTASPTNPASTSSVPNVSGVFQAAKASSSSSSATVSLSGVGTGCDDGYCIWVTGTGFTPKKDMVAEVWNANWKLLNTYTSTDLSITDDTSPQSLSFALATAAEQKALLKDGLIVTISNGASWNSLTVAAPTGIQLNSAGNGCANGYCIWLEGSGFSWATQDIIVQVKDSGWNLLNTYSYSEISINTSSSPQVISFSLKTQAEQQALLNGGLEITVSDGPTWNSIQVLPALIPAGLFRIGTGGYLSTGMAYCELSSGTQMKGCGFTEAQYDSATNYSSVPPLMTSTGVCGCSASSPWTLPAGLFQVGGGGYYSNGTNGYCELTSGTQLIACGFTEGAYAASPQYSATPSGMQNNGVCGCGTNADPALAAATSSNTTAPATGSVNKGSSFVLYDASQDTASGCAPFLDSSIFPVSVASGNTSAVSVSLNAVSPTEGGNNYWVTGQLSANGSEISPFKVNCKPIMTSPHNPTSSLFEGSQWLGGFYKQPDGTLYGIVHNEYYGGSFPPGYDFVIPASSQCDPASSGQSLTAYGQPVNPFGCTYTGLDMMVMAPGATQFSPIAAAPNQVIAQPSFGYSPVVGNAGGANGYFTNTNVIKNGDGYYYAVIAEIMADRVTQVRCTMRTSDITTASLWRAWDGKGFNTNLPAGADCVNDPTTNIALFPSYLGYSAYFGKAILVGAMSVGGSAQVGYSLSSDFVHWSTPVSFGVTIFDAQQAGKWSANNYPSLIDPGYLQDLSDGDASTGSIVGQSPWLTIVQHNGTGGTRALAIPVSFSQ